MISQVIGQINLSPEHLWIVVAILLLRLEPDRLWTLLRLVLGCDLAGTSRLPGDRDNASNADANQTITSLQNQLRDQENELAKLIGQNRKQARYNAAIALGFSIVAMVEVFS